MTKAAERRTKEETARMVFTVQISGAFVSVVRPFNGRDLVRFRWQLARRYGAVGGS